MQSTPAGYAPYPDARWTDFRVVFRQVDTTAQSDATPGATGSDIAQLARLIDDDTVMSGPWATWENDGFRVDRSVKLFPDDTGAHSFGWWSILSGADGAFSSPPMVSFDFATTHSVVGTTIYFDGTTPQYPAEIRLTYRAGGSVVATQTDTVGAVVHVVDLPALNFDRLELEILSTHKPYQSARVAEVLFGVVETLDRTNSTGLTLTCGISPAAESLESTTLTVTTDNTDRRYNLANPSGIYAYLQDGQKIDVEIGVGTRAALTYVNMGRLFFSAAQAEDNAMTAEITANDLFLALDGSLCNIGATGTWTLAAAVSAIISDSGLDITANIAPAVASRVIRKCIPRGTTHREALRLAVQAARCTCWFDRDGVLVCRELLSGPPVDEVSNAIMPGHPQAVVMERINTVVLTVRDEFAGTDTEYTASSAGPDEFVRSWSVINPLANSAAVADWLLAVKQCRLVYVIQTERGNPAREIGDTVTVYDAYGNEVDAVQTRLELMHSAGALSAGGELWRCG